VTPIAPAQIDKRKQWIDPADWPCELHVAGTAIMNDIRSETETAGATMRATFDAQRSSVARESATSLRQRLSDLTKLRDAVEKNAD
jgi:hypothetical protein